MKRRCPGSKLIRKGVLNGYRLTFNGYSCRWGGGVADVIKNKHKVVWGLLYSITLDDLSLLDGYEGYPTVYNRKLVSIKDTRTLKLTQNVWVYYMVKKTKFSAPSKKYLNIIKGGAHNYNFPKYYRAALNKIKTASKAKSSYQNFLVKDRRPILKNSGKTGIGLRKPIPNKIVNLPNNVDRTYILDDDELWNNEDKDVLEVIETGQLSIPLNEEDPDNLFYD